MRNKKRGQGMYAYVCTGNNNMEKSSYSSFL